MLRPSIHCQIKSHGLFSSSLCAKFEFSPISPIYCQIDKNKRDTIFGKKKIVLEGTASPFEATKKKIRSKAFKTSEKAASPIPTLFNFLACMCVGIFRHLFLSNEFDGACLTRMIGPADFKKVLANLRSLSLSFFSYFFNISFYLRKKRLDNV